MLPQTSELIIFLSAVFFLNLIPGSDVLYIASQSLHHKTQGLCAVFGISTGICVYIIASSLGLTVILHQSILAFNCVKIIGGIYLLYLAWKAFRSKNYSGARKDSTQNGAWPAYRKGIATTLLNPKVGLFFLTFLPQFIDPHRGKIGLQLLFLGLCFIVSGTLVNLMYAFMFSYLKERVFSKTFFKRWINKITGLIFIALALKVFSAKAT